MNRELLTKLYSEAVEYCVKQPPNADGTNKAWLWEAWLWEEKFAELIINECLDIVDAKVQGMDGVNAMKAIEEHFGVK